MSAPAADLEARIAELEAELRGEAGVPNYFAVSPSGLVTGYTVNGRTVRGGTGTCTFPGGSTTGDLLTVAHGLGVRPASVVCGPIEPITPPFVVSAPYVFQTSNYQKDTFDVRAVSPGSAPLAGNVPFSWEATTADQAMVISGQSVVGPTDEPWRPIGTPGNPAYQNGWFEIAGSPAFRKTRNGILLIRGLFGGGNTNTTMFTLPPEYRPTYQNRVRVVDDLNGAGTFALIDGSGTVAVNVNKTAAGWVDLSAISTGI